MFGWNPVHIDPQREHQSNEIYALLFPIVLGCVYGVTPGDLLLYRIYCCCFARFRNLPNTIILGRDRQHGKRRFPRFHHTFLVFSTTSAGVCQRKHGGLRGQCCMKHLFILYICVWTIHFHSRHHVEYFSENWGWQLRGHRGFWCFFKGCDNRISVLK